MNPEENDDGQPRPIAVALHPLTTMYSSVIVGALLASELRDTTVPVIEGQSMSSRLHLELKVKSSSPSHQVLVGISTLLFLTVK